MFKSLQEYVLTCFGSIAFSVVDFPDELFDERHYDERSEDCHERKRRPYPVTVACAYLREIGNLQGVWVVWVLRIVRMIQRTVHSRAAASVAQRKRCSCDVDLLFAMNERKRLQIVQFELVIHACFDIFAKIDHNVRGDV